MGRARRELTLADYVAIAISPVLIMTLVGSLVFFLLEVVYRGEHSTRIQWVLICFVGGMVLVARIGIEQGVEQAQLYGGVLLVVTLLFTFRFLDAFTVAAGLLFLIAFCAWKLTWDCTLVDDSEDASGEGLLRATGLEVEAGAGGTTAAEGAAGGSTASPALRSLVVEGPAETKRPAVAQEDLAGVRAPVPTVLVSGRGLAEEAERKAERAERSAARQKKTQKPHAPGVWVVYFSLAALPLFGLGQLLIPATQSGRRGYAFGLLVVYVASGLGLLLTTSFLGLRRYLRQRGVTMPGGVTRAWLLLGLAMAVGVLGLATLLPRPSGVYTFNDLIDRLEKQVAASKWALFDGDAGEGEGAPGAVVAANPAGEQPPGQNPGGAPPNRAADPAGQKPGDLADAPAVQAPGGEQPGGEQPGGEQPGGSQAGGNQPGGKQPGAGPGDAQGRAQGQSRQGSQPAPPQASTSSESASPEQAPDTDPASQPESSSKQSPSETQDPNSESPESPSEGKPNAPQRDPQGARDPNNPAGNPKPNPGPNPPPNARPPGGAERPDQPRPPAANRPGNRPPPRDEAGRAGGPPPAATPPPATPPSADPLKSALSQFTQFLGSLGGPLKWLIYGLLALLGLFLVFWKAGAILDFLARLWQAFLGLFGGQSESKREPGTEPLGAEEPRRFADFPNPYTNGTARRMKLPQLLDYSFQALEAWARERRVPLRNGQTPLEFAQSVAARIPAIEPEVTRAAQWYAQVAYGKRAPAGDPHEVFEKLWRRLDDTAS